MRKVLIGILLAGAAASPALAQDQVDGRWHRDQQQNNNGQAREERHQQRDQARGQTREQVRAERPNGAPNAQGQPQGDPRGFDHPRFQRVNNAPPPQMPQQIVGHPHFQQVNSMPPVQVPPQPYGRVHRGQNGFSNGQAAPVEQVDRRNWNGDEQNWHRGRRDAQQDNPNVRNRGPLVVSPVPREGTQPPQRFDQRNWQASNWNRHWRDNDRYDWRDWRDSHRTIFHIGIYYDPFGWGYRPYQIGWRLWPNYYSQQFWIDDPWMYRLPYAPPGLVWVRYWDDALLVDTYTGEVVDVIHNFFW